MKLSIFLQRMRRGVHLQHAVIVLSGTLVIGYGLSTLISLDRSYRQTTGDAVARLESIARSAEIGTNRAIFEVDTTLLGVQQMLAAVFPDTPLTDPVIKTVLRQSNDQTHVVRDIILVDNNGQELNSAASTTGRSRDYRDDPLFTTHQSRLMPALYISEPRRNPATGTWSIMVSRPLMRRDTVLGVIAAEVPISIFTEYFASIMTTGETWASLLLANGVLAASEPHREELLGKEPPFAAAIVAAAANSRSGYLSGVGQDDANPRARIFRKIPARPLIVTVSRDRGDILRQWRKEAGASAAAFALFAIMATLLTALVVRALKRQQAATAELAAREEQLKGQSALLQSTLENIGEGLSVFDRDGRLIAWNRRFADLLTLPSPLTTATTLRDILAMQAERGDFGPVDPATDVASRVARFYSEVPVVRERLTANGQIQQIRRRGMPDGAVVSLYFDITERKAAEEKMAQAWAQAELGNRAKSDFLANMSHELRTPLNAIIGFSEVICNELLGPVTDKKYLEYIEDIHTSGMHLLAIVNDVLDMSKIEAGKMELAHERVNIQHVIGEAVRMVSERARNRGLELAVQLPEDITILADERAIKQITLNLLSNAVKFSRERGHVDIRGAIDDAGGFVLEVEDYGIGMTKEETARALQPFGQVKPVATRDHSGTGLGLPITKGLVEAHGGQLAIESCAGAGTLVRVILPPHAIPLAAIRDRRAVA